MASFLCVAWWLIAGALAGWLTSGLVASLLKRPPPAPVQKIVENVVEIDNPQHLRRIRELEIEASNIPALQIQIQALQAASRQATVKPVEKPVPDAQHLEEWDRQFQDWHERFGVLEKRVEEQTNMLAARDEALARLKRPTMINLDAAKAAGFNLKGADDLEIIEGIGPKIAELFYQAGVKTFAQLAEMTPHEIQPMLDKAGPNFRMADPETWPERADLAARNRWKTLKSLQQILNAGSRGDDK